MAGNVKNGSGTPISAPAQTLTLTDVRQYCSQAQTRCIVAVPMNHALPMPRSFGAVMVMMQVIGLPKLAFALCETLAGIDVGHLPRRKRAGYLSVHIWHLSP